jgi:hypothetical protein
VTYSLFLFISIILYLSLYFKICFFCVSSSERARENETEGERKKEREERDKEMHLQFCVFCEPQKIIAILT